MISEHQLVTFRFRSEGEDEAAKILGNRQLDLSVIESKAHRGVHVI
ncbi:MAG: hypothetical protein ACI87O_002577 [Planctomycetota bacterium]|jgi:hypothetical protein